MPQGLLVRFKGLQHASGAPNKVFNDSNGALLEHVEFLNAYFSVFRAWLGFRGPCTSIEGLSKF